jgi:hypothetical protein
MYPNSFIKARRTRELDFRDYIEGNFLFTN